MPAVTNMRIMARKGLLSEDDAAAVLQVPLSFKPFLEIILRNKQALIREFPQDFGVPLHVQTIERFYAKVFPQTAATTTDDDNKDTPTDESSPATAPRGEILVFDDEQNASELVFGIGVSQ